MCTYLRSLSHVPFAQSGQHSSINTRWARRSHNTPHLPQCISISKPNILGEFALTVRSLLPGSDTPTCWGTTPTMHRGGSHRDAHNMSAPVGGCCRASVSRLLNVFVASRPLSLSHPARHSCFCLQPVVSEVGFWSRADSEHIHWPRAWENIWPRWRITQGEVDTLRSFALQRSLILWSANKWMEDEFQPWDGSFKIRFLSRKCS